MKSDEIKKIIEEHCISIGDYQVNPDGSIDVYGDVDFSNSSSSFQQLPLLFHKVGGNFDCSNLGLTSLKGSPKEVGGNYDCSYNRLTSLEFVPEKVAGVFIFDNSVAFIGNVNSDFTHVMMLRRIDDNLSLLPTFIKENSRYLRLIFNYQFYYEIWDENGSLDNKNWECLILDIQDGLL